MLLHVAQWQSSWNQEILIGYTSCRLVVNEPYIAFVADYLRHGLTACHVHPESMHRLLPGSTAGLRDPFTKGARLQTVVQPKLFARLASQPVVTGTSAPCRQPPPWLPYSSSSASAGKHTKQYIAEAKLN